MGIGLVRSKAIDRQHHGDSARGIRDLAILILLATCGLRSGEVIGLRLEDLDLGT